MFFCPQGEVHLILRWFESLLFGERNLEVARLRRDDSGVGFRWECPPVPHLREKQREAAPRLLAHWESSLLPCSVLL